MALWQFALIDYTKSQVITTPIDEPVGWDAFTLHIKRDPQLRGFFSYEDDSFSNLQYDTEGADILRHAYYTYGVDARVELSIKYLCNDSARIENVYIGRFDFSTFNEVVSDRCYIECSIVVSESLLLYKKRADQQVDLDSLASFDQLPVFQTITGIAAEFQGGTNIIRVGTLLNGLLAGSKITVSGATNPDNNGIFSVASAKPDYTNVNPDLTGGNTPTDLAPASVTFNAINGTISVNIATGIATGEIITAICATFPGPTLGSFYDNSGTYLVTNVQQFFGYTVFTVTVQSISNTGAVNHATNTMISNSQDTVILQGNFITTALPTTTLIQLPLQPIALIDENATITLSGYWLINNMKPYAGLGKIITVPSKEIQATSIYKLAQDKIYSIEADVTPNPGGPMLPGDILTVQMSMDFPNVVSDIDESDVGTGLWSVFGFDATRVPDTIIFFRQGSLACTGLASLKYNIKFQWELYNSSDPTNIAISAQFLVYKGSDPATFLTTGTFLLGSSQSDMSPVTSYPWGKQEISGEVDNIEFAPGEYLWVIFAARITNNNTSNSHAPNLIINANSFVDFTINSQCTETPCSVYLVNEAMSRCLESYTNGDLVTYSDYFGRKNAQPEPSIADGCGGLECITNGVRVRGCFMPDGSAIPKFFTSFKEMIEALDAIHNIGVGYERDPTRNGFYRLRVEPFEWFFQSYNMLTCGDIMKFERTLQQSMLPSTFTVGYQQFETWNNNGLYDIFGKRTYRTPLNQLQNDYQKVCKWMASDYAIEFMRREWGTTTADGRYDSETFILCLEDKFKGPVEFVQSGIYMLNINNLFVIGGNYTISGAANPSNNISFTISTSSLIPVPIVLSHAPNSLNNLSFIFIPSTSFVNEFNPSVSVIKTNLPINAVENIPCYFIGPNGAIVLDKLELFNAEPNDALVISNTLHNDGTYIINEIFSPVSATQQGDLIEIEFPMIIFPVAPLLFNVYYEYGAQTIINDTINQFYAVEQGMENGTNILSPDTVMNYRISPAHNAMRHFRNVIADRNFIKQILYFTGGDGNFYALGTINDGCTPENGNISEGGNLDHTNFSVLTDAQPLFYAEIIKFEYPLAWEDFLSIQANPYGLISFSNHEYYSQGWLVDLQYNPYTGMATFELYPKIN